MKIGNKNIARLVNAFEAIRPADYQAIIRFYESNAKEIDDLSFEDSVRIKYSYYNSLYSVKAYEQLLSEIDEFIQLVIMENVFQIEKKDVFTHMLSIKAFALHHTMQYENAEYVMRELFKLQIPTKQEKRLFIRNSIQSTRYARQAVRGATIALYLLSGLLIATEILIIRTFHNEWSSTIETTRNIILLLATGLFVTNEVLMFLDARKKLISMTSRD